MPEVNKDLQIKEKFKEIWSEKITKIWSDSKIDKICKTNIGYL